MIIQKRVENRHAFLPTLEQLEEGEVKLSAFLCKLCDNPWQYVWRHLAATCCVTTVLDPSHRMSSHELEDHSLATCGSATTMCRTTSMKPAGLGIAI